MKINIKQNILQKALKQFSTIVNNKSLIPVMSNIKITASKDKIEFLGINDEIKLLYSITDGFDVKEEGVLLINYELISSLVSKITTQDIEFTKTEDNMVRFKANTFESDITLMDQDNFPIVDFDKTTKKQTILPTSTLKKIISKVCKATIQDKANVNKMLEGVFIDSTRLNGEIEAIGTDARILSYIKLPYSGIPFSSIIKANTLKYLNLDGVQEVIVYIGLNNKILIECNDLLYSCSMLIGNYPTNIIPKLVENNENEKQSFIVNYNDLKNTIEKAIIVSSQDETASKDIKIKISNEGLTISGRSNAKAISSEIISIGEPNIIEEITVAFNAQLFLLLLSNINSTNVTIKYVSKDTPFYIYDTDDETITNIIIPISF